VFCRGPVGAALLSPRNPRSRTRFAPLRRQLIQTDMELLSMFASVLDLSPTLRLLALGDTCREWCAVMNEQVGRTLCDHPCPLIDPYAPFSLPPILSVAYPHPPSRPLHTPPAGPRKRGPQSDRIFVQICVGRLGGVPPAHRGVREPPRAGGDADGGAADPQLHETAQ